jgi:hypothetical protein
MHEVTQIQAAYDLRVSIRFNVLIKENVQRPGETTIRVDESCNSRSRLTANCLHDSHAFSLAWSWFKFWWENFCSFDRQRAVIFSQFLVIFSHLSVIFSHLSVIFQSPLGNFQSILGNFQAPLGNFQSPLGNF